MASSEPYGGPPQAATSGQGPSAAEAASRPAVAAEVVKKQDTKRRSADQYLSLVFRQATAAQPGASGSREIAHHRQVPVMEWAGGSSTANSELRVVLVCTVHTVLYVVNGCCTGTHSVLAPPVQPHTSVYSHCVVTVLAPLVQ